jgi:hypothetical protein
MYTPKPVKQAKGKIIMTDQTGSRGTTVSAAWTVGQLRAALAGLPDDTPLVVNVADLNDPSVCDEQVLVSAGFGTINWGDGYGPEPDTVFGLNCEIPDHDMRTKPSRPRRPRGPEMEAGR